MNIQPIRRFLSFCAAVLLAASAAAADAPVRVLIFSGQNNHDWKTTTPKLQAILAASGRFSVEVTEHPEECDSATFAKYDVILSNWNTFVGKGVKEWPASTREAFLKFVRDGGGFVVVHAGSSSFYDWPEYQQIAGAWWKLGQTGHGKPHEFTVKPTDSAHPIMAGVEPFTSTDELWMKPGLHPAAKVLATAEDQPVALTTEFGKGRGFTVLMGHCAPFMATPGFQTLLTRGTEWAATGKVTLPILPTPKPEAKADSGYKWEQAEGSLALLNGEKTVWKLHFDKKEGKPFFHPLALTDGTELTALRPSDHPWHKAIWSSWKILNGVNVWEKNEDCTVLLESKASANADFSARIEMTLEYRLPGAAAVLAEKRVILVTAPDAAGNYRVDWSAVFTATDKDVVLTRTPLIGQPGGAGHGGYAGFSARMSASTRGWGFTSSEGATTPESIHGKPARWVDFSGKNNEGGLAIFDHPKNLRYPTPWYVAAGMPYFSPAVLFNDGYTIPAGQSLPLQYRLLVHRGTAPKELLDKECESFGKN